MAQTMYKEDDFGPLHSAAVTGDKESLKNCFKNNLCDVNNKDKVQFVYLRCYYIVRYIYS